MENSMHSRFYTCCSIVLLLLCVSPFFAQEEKIGLCLSGGGAKGAYQVGVWKALQEYDYIKNIVAISGTSVGALNAALFTCNEQQKIEVLWTDEIGFFEVLSPDISKIDYAADATAQFAEQIKDSYNAYIEDSNTKKDAQIKTTIDTSKDLLKEITNYISNFMLTDKPVKGIFSREPLLNIINENISYNQIKESKSLVYVTAIKKRRLAAKGLTSIFWDDYSHVFKLQDQLSMSNISSLLLASSAIPVAFDTVTLPEDIIENGRKVGKSYEYTDGGFELVGGKNIPIKPLVQNKEINTIIVVYLKSEEELQGKSEQENHNRITSEEVKGKKLIEIIPSEPLGNFLKGTLNFDKSQIKKLVDLGYNDTINILNKIQNTSIHQNW